MYELTDGGRCLPADEAIKFMEMLPDVIDEEAKTEEFCDAFTWALNRFRAEVRTSIPVPVKKLKIRFTTYSCGRCGHGVNPEYVYCS